MDWYFGRVVISAGRNNNSLPGGKNWQKLAKTGKGKWEMGSVLDANCI